MTVLETCKPLNLRLAAAATLLAAALLLTAAPPAHAQATGTTDFDVILDPLCILYYYSEMDVTLPASVMSDLLTDATLTAGTTINGVDHFQADEGTVAVTAAAIGTDLDALLASPGGLASGLDLTALDLNINECWAVRCIASATSNTYDIEIERGDGTGPGPITLVGPTATDTIVITDSGIRGPGVGAFTAEATAITNPVPGLATPDVGDCQLTLDFSGANAGGTYTSAANTDFTITLTHN